MPHRRFWLVTGATVAACLIALLAAMPSVVAAQTTPLASPALPQGDDLTLADGAGNVLIGLTVRPAQPGPNTVLIHVLPLEGAATAADVSVILVVNGQPVPLDFCSRTCRTALVPLVGGEHVDVVADNPFGGTATHSTYPRCRRQTPTPSSSNCRIECIDSVPFAATKA